MCHKNGSLGDKSVVNLHRNTKVQKATQATAATTRKVTAILTLMSILLLQMDSTLSAPLGIYVPSGPRRNCTGLMNSQKTAAEHHWSRSDVDAQVFRRISDEFAPYLSLTSRAGCSSVEGFTVEVSCWLSESECLVNWRIQRNREGREEGTQGAHPHRAL